MNSSHESAGATAPTVCCVLAAHAFVSVPVEGLGELRKSLIRPGGAPLPANFLRHADEQTCAGIAAVFEAIRDFNLPAPFTSWGVVGAPRFLGCSPMSSDLPRFLVEGAWDVSPHMIPHRSLHSLSGSVSQALAIHGPNFGAGGGPGAEVEGLFAAFALLEGMHLPGVWLVMTRLCPELSADHTTGKPVPGTLCQGLALALMPVGAPGAMTIEVGVGRHSASSLTLTALAESLGQARQHSCVSLPLGAQGKVTIRRPPAALPGPHFPLQSLDSSLASR